MKGECSMQKENQNQNLQGITNMPPQQNHGGHELMDAHEAIGALTGALEQYLLYEEHIQDQKLQNILNRQRTFLTTLYNSLAETLKTGQPPSVKTQNYLMQEDNDVIYGMKQTPPKAPAQSVSEINDQCVTSFMMGAIKACATGFTGAALESTNPILRRVFADSVPNLVEMGYEIFLYQNKKQYYQVPQLQPQDMQAITNGYAPIQNNNMTH